MNNAKKIETIVPVVGTILIHQNGKQSPSKVVLVNHDKRYVTVFRPNSRTSRTTIQFSSLRKYDVATEADFPGVDFSETDGGRSTLTNRPSAPRATVAHEPAPTPPPPAVNDTTAAPMARVDLSILEFFEKKRRDDIAELNERLDRAERSRREETNALHESIRMTNATLLAALAKIDHAKPELKSGEPTPKADESAAKDQRMTDEHMEIFKDLVPKFVGAELELIDIRDPAQVSSALRAKDVWEMFVAWCSKGKHSTVVCYQHAFYNLLKKIHGFRADKKGKVITPWMKKNTRQMSFDLSERPDGISAMAGALAVIAYARDNVRQWRGMDLAPHLPTVVELIKSKTFTKDELLKAMDAMNDEPRGSTNVWPPAEIFTTPNLCVLIGRKPVGGAK